MTYQQLQKLDFDYHKAVKKHDIDLPILTPYSWKVPYKFGKFPKNVSKYVLDNFSYCMPISKILYNLGVIDKGTKYSINVIDSHRFGVGPVNGPDLFDIGVSYSGSSGRDLILANKMELGDIDDLYDRLAFESGPIGGTANVRLGVYDTATGGKPTNLDGETGSFTHVINDFSWHSITEYSLSTTQNWVAVITSANGNQMMFDFASPASSRWHKSWTFGVFENPFTDGTLNENIINTKMGHS